MRFAVIIGAMFIAEAIKTISGAPIKPPDDQATTIRAWVLIIAIALDVIEWGVNLTKGHK